MLAEHDEAEGLGAVSMSAGRLEITTDTKNRQSEESGRQPGTDAAMFSGLIAATREWESEISEIPVGPATLRFSARGVEHGTRFFGLDEPSRSRLFNKVGAPIGYLMKHAPAFQAATLAEHANRGDFGLAAKLVVRNDQIITLLKDDLLALSNASVLTAVKDALGRDVDELLIRKIDLDYDHLELILVSPSKAITVRPGDVVQSGLRITHHRFGGPATLIEAFIYRLVCSNGMTRRECVGEGGSRTRKLPVGDPNSHELQMSQIYRLTQQNWNNLQAQLDAFKATRERPAHVEELLGRWLQRGRLSPRLLLGRLMHAWREEGSENTVYGAVNALTRVATHDAGVSSRQRRALAVLGGLLAFSQTHICERCFSILAAGTESASL